MSLWEGKTSRSFPARGGEGWRAKLGDRGAWETMAEAGAAGGRQRGEV